MAQFAGSTLHQTGWSRYSKKSHPSVTTFVIAVPLFVWIVCVTYYLWHLRNLSAQQEPDIVSPADYVMRARDHTSVKDKQVKKILLWNSFWDEPGWEIGLGREPFHRLQCPVNNCEITDDRRSVNESDAVLFHVHQLRQAPPIPRPTNQRWVFFMLESPGWSKNHNYKKWSGLFNWTMTYRQDSDILLDYGKIEPQKDFDKKKKLHSYWDKVFKKKERPVAWVVSNCHTQSRREQYMRELQKYIPVDIYGRCGNLSCKKDWAGGDERCLKMIAQKYWFYIAFENSFCKDYVTEKFFKMLHLDIVPIVRGGAKYYKFAPYRWFLNTNEFKSPKSMASYLKFLIRKRKDYLTFFRRKEQFRFKAFFGLRHLHGWCELCRKLNNKHEPEKFYSDIGQWWNERDCHNPADITA